MNYKDKTKEQLINELSEMRQHIAELESPETQQNHIKKALPGSGQYYELLIEVANNVGVGIIIAQDVRDREGAIVFINDAVSKIMGYSREELLQMRLSDLVPPAAIPEHLSRYRRRQAGKETEDHYEAVVTAKDGTEVPMQIGASTAIYRDKPAIVGFVRDITERKQAEVALQHSKEYYQALIENAFDAIMIINADGIVSYVSPSIKFTLGYELEEFIGKHIFDFIHPEDLQEFIDGFQEQIEISGYTLSMEVRARHKDGSWRNIEGTGTNLLEHPSVAGIVGNFRDITERKQAEEKFKQLLGDISEGYIVYQDNKIVVANKRFAEIYGYTVNQVLGKDLLAFIAPNGIQDIAERYTRVISGEEAPERYEIKSIKQDGTEIIIDMGIKAIEYEGKPAFSNILRDITEHKRIDEKLKKSERFYRTILETAVDGYWSADMKGRFIDVNNSYCQMIGYSRNELLSGMSISDVEDMESAEDVALHIKYIIEHGYDLFETRHRRKDGQVIDVEVSSRYLDLEGGQLVVFIREITESKRKKEELQQLYEKEMKLRELLEEERKRRIEFTRVLVHELKTPLTPLLAGSQLLVEEVRDETLVRLAESINKGAFNMSNMVNDLLDITKAEIGRLELEFKPVDVLQLLDRAAEYIAPMAASNKHSLILDLPQSLPLIRADETRLRQVILNLLNNASKFTPAGGRITLRAREKDASMIMEVQDTGSGISEEEHQRIFEPYHRVEGDRQRLSGLGMGLALCKTLVELHGGQIWVESSLGEGSTFGFSLPLEDSQCRT